MLFDTSRPTSRNTQQKALSLKVQFFVDQNYKPFIVQFFWQKLQTF